MKHSHLFKSLLCLSLSMAVTTTLTPAALCEENTRYVNPSAVIVMGGERIRYTSVDMYGKTNKVTSLIAKEPTPYNDLPTIGSYLELLRYLDDQHFLYEKKTMDLAGRSTYISGEFRYGTINIVPDALEEGTAEPWNGVGNAPAYSETNAQVSGVDEGDILKTDGKNIYYATPGSATVRIVSVDGKQMKRASTIAIDKALKGDKLAFQQMYVTDDTLVIAATRQNPCEHDTSVVRTYIPSYKLDPAYMIDSHPSTVVLVYDVKTPSKPVRKRSVEISGEVYDTRMVGNRISLVTTTEIHPVMFDAKLRKEHILPHYADSAKNGGATQVISPREIGILPGVERPCYTTIASFDVTNAEPIESCTVLGSIEDMYMNQNRLYLTREVAASYRGIETRLFRFNLDGGKVKFTSAGKVAGRVLNQYAMDEYKGNLRVATTNNDGNHLYVLNAGMKTIGQIANLAPGEDIKSVRYAQSTGYVVTYEEIDPLFVIDLSVAEKPTVLGELKIPGFSQYMHPIADGFLVGIGVDTMPIYVSDDEVMLSMFADNGMKISMFDVRNPHQPKEIFNLPLGIIRSPVSTNPRALMVDTNRNLLIMPAESLAHEYEGGKNVPEIDLRWRLGCLAIGYDTQKGFAVKASIDVRGHFTAHSADDTRACYIGDTLYVVTNGGIAAYDYNFKQLDDASVLKFSAKS